VAQDENAGTERGQCDPPISVQLNFADVRHEFHS
jgi:hypothetical protein